MRSSTGWTAVNLNGQAGILVLDAGQQQKLTLHSTTIVSNFLSHWSTGQVQAFAAPALLGVMAAIDDFPECFRYEWQPGSRRYYQSLSRR